MSGGGDDETWLGDATHTDEMPLPAAVVEVPLLAGRYRVGGLLGRGGTGQVHEAVDTTSDEVVAIKFVSLRSKGVRRQLRQELTALRLLALPGVVRLHDDGEDGDQTFLVMDLLAGGGFDRLARHGWEGWQEQARVLLESLARVHFAGVLHLDLKPGNVLLDADERPVITDFGLARGRAVHNPDDAPREGTPRYMAPEQWRGEEPTPATDLYAIGGIFWEMLAGRALPKDPGARGLASDCAPEGVRSTVLAMLAEDPAERPQGVVEVLDALFDASAVLGPEALGLPEVATAAELEGLFDEEKPTFMHLARDAAKVLHQITGGERAKVRAELDRWVRAGLAWWNGARVHIERPAIEQIRWGLDPESRRLAELARTDPESAVSEAIVLADVYQAEGRTNRVVGVSEGILPLARSLGMGSQVAEGVLRVSLNDPTAHGRALNHAMRSGSDIGVKLVRSVRAQQNGEWARAVELLRDAVAQEVPAKLRDAVGAFYGQALRISDADAYVRWLDEPPAILAPALLHGARGAWAYQSGAFDVAEREHRKAAHSGDSFQRIAAWSNAAAAAVEIPDRALAWDALQRVSRALKGRAAPLFEARAHWLGRMIQYRLDGMNRLGIEHLDAMEAVSERMATQLALVEGAAAWRTQASEAEAIVARASRGYHAHNHAAGALLADALLAAVQTTPMDLDPEVCGKLPPAFAVQVLALHRLAGGQPLPWTTTLERARVARPGFWRSRLDVLTLEEASTILETGALGDRQP